MMNCVHWYQCLYIYYSHQWTGDISDVNGSCPIMNCVHWYCSQIGICVLIIHVNALIVEVIKEGGPECPLTPTPAFRTASPQSRLEGNS